MTLEVLISCMHQSDTSIAERTGCKSDVLIINQSDKDGYEEKYVDGHKIRMFTVAQRGLSRSRNMALINAKGDICLISDDDSHLVDNYDRIIVEAFKRMPEADIVAFNYYEKNCRATRKKYIKEEKKAPYFRSFTSGCLAFKRESILGNNVFFDLRIGAGSGIISAGEESAWQYFARKKKLKIYQCPEFITEMDQSDSTWFSGYNEQYFYDLGANLSYKYGWLKYLYMLYYPYRLRKDETIPVFAQIKWMFKGIAGFKKGMGYKQYINEYGNK